MASTLPNAWWNGICLAIALGLVAAAVRRRWVSGKSQNFRWQEQVVVVTGGSNGLGLAVANAIRQRHSNTKIVSLDIEECLHINESKIIHISCDVSDIHQVRLARDHILSTVGVPTILINSAAIVQGKYLTELTEAEIKRTIDVNLLGPMWVTKAFLPHMIAADVGHILCISSAAGLVGLAWLTDYCATKFGLYGFHESLRQELRHTSIRTSIVCPAHINTRLFQHVHPPFQLLTPSLCSKYVAQRIISVIEGGKSYDLWMPIFVHTALIVRAVPIWLNDFSHWVMRTNEYWPLTKAPLYAQRKQLNKKRR